ncbi:two pore domain potassium channel family protein [Candidatus Saccharibacteria bacterium]|nr:two pore domain potassium channel family protein [Candidatus Saccharibacteria bacterium]MCB9821483.1 two pore domain potassium channel family protein [Candidatus Nomurabacteria bacterium]
MFGSVRARVTIGSLVGLLLIGTLSYHWLESWTWIECFYFSVVTLTTVGYGDIHPTNDTTRLFTAIFILFGVAIAISALGMLSDSYIKRRTGK